MVVGIWNKLKSSGTPNVSSYKRVNRVPDNWSFIANGGIMTEIQAFAFTRVSFSLFPHIAARKVDSSQPLHSGSSCCSNSNFLRILSFSLEETHTHTNPEGRWKYLVALEKLEPGIKSFRNSHHVSRGATTVRDTIFFTVSSLVTSKMPRVDKHLMNIGWIRVSSVTDSQLHN